MRSPNTALDAQLSVDFGLENIRGFIHIQKTAGIVKQKDQGPIHFRLQIASIRMGNAVNRVQTLHGLACFSQVSSNIKKSLAIRDSNVCPIANLPRTVEMADLAFCSPILVNATVCDNGTIIVFVPGECPLDKNQKFYKNRLPPHFRMQHILSYQRRLYSLARQMPFLLVFCQYLVFDMVPQ